MRVRAEEGSRTSAARQRAIVLRPVFGAEARDQTLRLGEALGLAIALDLDVTRADLAPLRQRTPATLFGTGRVEALADEVKHNKVDLLVVDAALTPTQQRNLERAVNAKVVDRTGLILEIFARRAHTREGALQVELARQEYEKSRLVRTWTHLERQRGGLGKLGGPGETQLETDRRLVRGRIEKLKIELEKVRRTRGLQRRARTRAGLPAVVFVGYTNAGKSSLFNRLTAAGVLAKNMPFATLDPTARLVRLPSGREAIIADTVGFITDLPTELVASFRATLEAVAEADVLVHVRDIAHPESDNQETDVQTVLGEVLAQAEHDAAPMIEAWNKIDLLGDDRRAARLRRAPESDAVAVSALTGEGLNALLAAIDRAAYGPTQAVTLALDPADGRTRAMIAAQGRILDEHMTPSGLIEVRAELPARAAARFRMMLATPERMAAE
jgi:GTP-binding protein HflX